MLCLFFFFSNHVAELTFAFVGAPGAGEKREEEAEGEGKERAAKEGGEAADQGPERS